MATNFPTSLDTFVDPAPTNLLDGTSVAGTSHAAQHDNLNDAVAALEAKVGTNTSAVTTSLDYIVNHLSAAPPSAAQPLVNGFGNMHRVAVTATPSGRGGGTLWLVSVVATSSFTAANVNAYHATGTSGNTLLKYGIYSLDSSGNGTLVRGTTNGVAQQGAGGKVIMPLTSSVAISAGTTYALAVVNVGNTGPGYVGNTAMAAPFGGASVLAAGVQPFAFATLGSQTDLPSSFTFGSLTALGQGPYMEVTT